MLGFVALVIASLSFLPACTSVPTAQLQGYSDAFDEAEAAAVMVYADAAPALRSGNPAASPVRYPVSLGPEQFDRGACGEIMPPIPELTVRCKAMETLQGYNQALLDIASGKSTNEILRQIDSAFASVSVLGAIPSATVQATLGTATAALPLIKGLLGEALKLRDRALLKEKLSEGAPQIRELLAALHKDVRLLYAVHRTYAEGQLDEAKSRIDRSLSRAFRTVADHAAPTDPAAVSSLRLLSQRFDEVFSAQEPKPGERLQAIKASAVAGSKPLDGVAVASVEAQLNAASGSVVEFNAIATRYRKSVEALRRYDDLLNAVDKALADLIAASNNPFAPAAGTEQLLGSIIAIRDYSRDIRSLLSTQ